MRNEFPEIRRKAIVGNESPRRKQRGIKDQNRKKHSPQAAGYLPEQK